MDFFSKSHRGCGYLGYGFTAPPNRLWSFLQKEEPLAAAALAVGAAAGARPELTGFYHQEEV